MIERRKNQTKESVTIFGKIEDLLIDGWTSVTGSRRRRWSVSFQLRNVSTMYDFALVT